MTTLTDAQGALVRFFQHMAEAAPVAWRHDPLFRGASVGAGVTLALLLLRAVGPHNPDLDAPTVHYDPATRQTTPSQPPPVAEVPKIAPGQPLNSTASVPVPAAGDHFGTFTPGQHP